MTLCLSVPPAAARAQAGGRQRGTQGDELRAVPAALFLGDVTRAYLKGPHKEPIVLTALPRGGAERAGEVGLCVRKAEGTEAIENLDPLPFVSDAAVVTWGSESVSVDSRTVVAPPEPAAIAAAVFPRMRSVLASDDLGAFWFDAPEVKTNGIKFKLHIRDGTPMGAIARVKAELAGARVRSAVQKKVADAITASLRARAPGVRPEQLGTVNVTPLDGMAVGLQVALALAPLSQTAHKTSSENRPSVRLRIPGTLKLLDQLEADLMRWQPGPHGNKGRFLLLQEFPDQGAAGFVFYDVFETHDGRAPFYYVKPIKLRAQSQRVPAGVDASDVQRLMARKASERELRPAAGNPGCFYARLAR